MWNRFVPEKPFKGAESSSSRRRDGPVEFERNNQQVEDDPFQLDQFMKDARHVRIILYFFIFWNIFLYYLICNFYLEFQLLISSCILIKDVLKTQFFFSTWLVHKRCQTCKGLELFLNKNVWNIQFSTTYSFSGQKRWR